MGHGGHRPTDPAGPDRPAGARFCVVCGRGIQWRRKWARDWGVVKYCSDACRRRGLTPGDRALEQIILELLGQRARGALVDQSEVLRRVPPSPDRHADLEAVRMAARRLYRSGQIEIIQQGRLVDPDTARGPIQLRRRDPSLVPKRIGQRARRPGGGPVGGVCQPY